MIIDSSDIFYKRFVKFSYISMFFVSAIGSINFYYEGFINSIADIVIIFLFIINLHTSYSKNSKIFVLLFFGVIYFIYLIYHGGFLNTGWLWVLTFSAFAFLLNNKRDALRWTLFFGFILLLILVSQILFDIETAYKSSEISILFSVYSMNSYLIYIFQKEVDLYTTKLQELNNSLENRVISEVKRNEKKDAMLSTQAKQAQMGEMISMIAHQWRQPLNAVSASAIKLKLENELGILTPAKIDESSHFIQEKTQDMSEIINSFLEFSKPDIEDGEFSILKGIRKALSMVNMQFNLHSIAIEISHDEEFNDNPIIGSENLFEQVLLNILLNTRDAFAECGDTIEKKILIFIDKIGNIQIKDNAGGIDPTVANKIFNPYFTTKEEGEGTGLGLYMSRKIMRTHFGGNLAYTALENGSCFKIVFNQDEEPSDV